MTWLKELVTNPFLITSTSSWFVAQVIKVIINFCVTKKLDWERLFGDGHAQRSQCHRIQPCHLRRSALRLRLV